MNHAFSSPRSFHVYLMTDKPYGTLYIGVTGDIGRRVYEHQKGLVAGFTKRYGLETLVYAEEYATAEDAIRREKQLKKWRRDWKIALIVAANPTWHDISGEVLS